VFVHGRSDGAHGAGSVRIVDETGSTLGDSLPDSFFSVDLSPGKHDFFGWETYANGKYPLAVGCGCSRDQCRWVAAMRAELAPGRTYYVWVERKKSGVDPSLPFDEEIDLERISPHLDQWPPPLTQTLRPMERALPAEDDPPGRTEAYRQSFVCEGQARVRRGTYWDPANSTLHPEDGTW
jgi:hypothetical protein